MRLQYSHTTYLVITIVGLAALGFFFIAPKLSEKFSSASETATTTPVKPDPKIVAFEKVKLEGKAAFVMDMTDGSVIYAQNADEPMPLASITKLMTGIVALDQIPAGIKGETVIDSQALSTDGDSGLFLGEKWATDDLVKFTLIESSNDGAVALARDSGDDTAEKDFIKKMNDKARELGLTRTIFLNPSGLDLDLNNAGAYGSARDVAHLMSAALFEQKDIIGSTARPAQKFTSLSGLTHAAKNTNKIVGELPGLIASKTGYTDIAGGNLVVAFDAGVNHPIIISVLGSTETGRFRDMLQLASSTLAFIKML